jgi:hypothetical protein
MLEMSCMIWRNVQDATTASDAKRSVVGGYAVAGPRDFSPVGALDYRQADVRACLAASKAASRSANLPLAAPARAMMMGTGNVSKK